MKKLTDRFRDIIHRKILAYDLSIEAKHINLAFVAGVFSTAASLIFLLFLRTPNLASIAVVMGILSGSLILMGIANRFRIFNTAALLTLILVCDILFPLTFFSFGGVNSGVPAYFILSIALIFLLMNGVRRVVMLAVDIAIIISCYTIGIMHPEWVRPLWGHDQVIDHIQAIIVSGFCIGFIVYFQSAINRAEREKQNDAQKQILYREQLLMAVNRSAEMLISEDFANPRESVLASMEMLCQHMEIDRVNIWKNIERDGELWYRRDIGWERASVNGAVQAGVSYPYVRSVPAWRKALSGGEVVTGIVSELSEDEQNTLVPFGVKSILVTPVHIRNEFWGFVSYDDCTSATEFKQEEIDILKSSSYLMANAIIRGDMMNDLRNAHDQALRGTKAKSDFLANMSHEIRTPLNAVMGMASIGKNASDPERKDYCFGKINDASSHLLGVINDILDMSKIEADKLELSPIAFDFEKMLRHVVDVSTYRIDEKKLHFMVYIDGNIPQMLIGDDQRIAQVITNLLSNAVKFTPEGGSISLSAYMLAQEGRRCTVTVDVKDTGIGISAEQQQHLFTSFQQADNSISRNFGGTGLGLAISKRIVELMDGEISVESELGKGSTFSFTATLDSVTTIPRSRRLKDMGFRDIRVLFVDDDSDIREYFIDIADRLGISCDTADSAERAKELIQRNPPYDMYFVDWKMPGADGIDLSKWIRDKNGSRAIIIMTSAFELSDVSEKAKAAGVDSFLAKPLFPSDIVDIINDSIGLEKPQTGGGDSAEQRRDDFSGFRILVVEDVEINREIVTSLLEDTHVAIDSAENGAVALKMYKDNPDLYDLMLMDLQMPVMDGYTATREIRKSGLPHSKDIPIIAMTANVFREDIEESRSAGMNKHIGKPLDEEDLLAVLRRYLTKEKS
ncbi:MAG: response regulator [Clostridiales Family XIII bacterium]|jgi:signal transduction histidine kinase/DNA-binding response OmpR family regulator|nr:response regulator [Clostridiales Family XIII bacterium]